MLRSYKELPIRYADFGALHRNELSGALTGLTRVRRFQQDDAHIFARHDQIESEVAGVLDMLQETYGILGFTFELNLSTRPEKFLGELEVWDRAELALAQTLDKFGQAWAINPGDGAFYGPKIDIQVFDALKRKHQCATIQLDFQLPIRFGLSYKAEGEGFETPVIIHRAILGSVERMFAILIEHTGGKWPFWLSPRQIMIITISEKYMPYAREIRGLLHDRGFYVDVEETNKQLNKKIREAQLAQYNLILVVGESEQAARSVNVRLRDSSVEHLVWSLPELLRHCKNYVDYHQ
jgi:threonyl-tRNA synthetase